MVSVNEMVSLHKYFFWCDRMRVLFQESLRDYGNNPIIEYFFKNEEYIKIQHLWATDVGLYMSYWYSGLYVVIEGWQELNLHDENIDLLLESPYVELLKRYRNGAFHYQNNDYDKRFSNFIDIGADTSDWILKLNNEFSRYFLDYFKRFMKENNILDLDSAIESVKIKIKQKEDSKTISAFIDMLMANKKLD